MNRELHGFNCVMEYQAAIQVIKKLKQDKSKQNTPLIKHAAVSCREFNIGPHGWLRDWNIYSMRKAKES